MSSRNHWEPLITPEESKDVRKWWWKKEDKVGNLNCPGHATASDAYREGYERIFGKTCELCGLKHRDEDTCIGYQEGA